MARRRRRKSRTFGSSRQVHEGEVTRQIAHAARNYKRATESSTCPATLRHLVEAAESNAKAWANTLSIGPRDSLRTRRLEAVIVSGQRRVRKALEGLVESGCIRQHPGDR